MLQFTASKTGESAELPKGESFEISLPENPATGFRWKITATGEPVSTMTGEDFLPSTGVGGQGIHCWRFRTIQAGESEIGMVLRSENHRDRGTCQHDDWGGLPSEHRCRRPGNSLLAISNNTGRRK